MDKNRLCVVLTTGVEEGAVYDEPDRPIRSVSGAMAAGGSGFRRVGTAPCGGGIEDDMPSDGALTERAYESGLVSSDGAACCPFAGIPMAVMTTARHATTPK